MNGEGGSSNWEQSSYKEWDTWHKDITQAVEEEGEIMRTWVHDCDESIYLLNMETR